MPEAPGPPGLSMSTPRRWAALTAITVEEAEKLRRDGVAAEWLAQGVLDVIKTEFWSFIPRRGSGRREERPIRRDLGLPRVRARPHRTALTVHAEQVFVKIASERAPDRVVIEHPFAPVFGTLALEPEPAVLDHDLVGAERNHRIHAQH